MADNSLSAPLPITVRVSIMLFIPVPLLAFGYDTILFPPKMIQ